MAVARLFHRASTNERFPSKPSTPSHESVEPKDTRSPPLARPRTASEQKRSKILPSLPLSSVSSSSSSLLHDPSPSPRGPRPTAISRSPSRRRQFNASPQPPPSVFHTRRLSSFFPPQPAVIGTRTFVSVVLRPAILCNVLSFLHWSDFRAVCQTSSTFRNVLKNRELRDVVLMKFVTGYGIALRNSDSRLRDEMGDIPITIHDISILLSSTSTPLHIYPAHALAMQSALYPSEEQQRKASRLTELTQAHSRFVLVLQSLAHCSSQPAPVENETEFEPAQSFPGDRSPVRPNSAQSRYTNVSLASNRTHGHVRELSFPAPLSQPTAVARASMEDASLSDSHRNQSSLHSSSSVRQVKSAASSPAKAKRRTSIFSINQAKQAPPPPSEPKDLRYYSSGWRQSLKNASSAYRHTRGATSASSETTIQASRGWQSEVDVASGEFGALAEPPRTLFSEPGHRGHRSQSSFGSVSGSLSAGSSTDPSSVDGSPAPSFVKSKLSQSPTTSFAPTPAYLQPSTLTTSSPHDLMLATSRVRAPVLRVFVPCSELAETSMGGTTGSIVKCEEQLIESGLWAHMSVGDIVCNLGYIPPSGSEEEEDLAMNRRGRKQPSRRQIRTWLVFDGNILVPFCPTLDPAPGPDPLLLPSPWYYEHVLPLATPLSPPKNMKMNISRIPPPPPTRTVMEPRMVLVNLPITVRSPHSNGGYAMVRKWAWTARVHRGQATPDFEIGVGWQGEWILEGEGTIEGRQELIDLLHGHGQGKRQWEFVRHRSGGGKIWLKLLDSSLPELRSQSHPPPPVLSTINSVDSIPRT